MRTLITGGAGFIGSHLCERLLERGHAVEVLDDLSTGRRDNVAHLLERPDFDLHRGSVADADEVERRVAGKDLVIHLAAAVGVRLILEEPIRTIDTNVQGTRHVLESASRHGARVLFASSSEVYGRSPELPFREDSELLFGATSEPRWSYACSKAMGEWLALAYARAHRLNVTVVRLFNTVGPRQRGRYGMVLPNFVRQALAGEPITIFGDGTQTRCFIHVHDTVEACSALLDAPAAEGQVVNVGGTHEISIGELAELVKDTLESPSPIVRMPYREAYGTSFQDLMRRRPDVERLASLTGFRPRRSLEKVVADLATDLRARAEGAVSR